MSAWPRPTTADIGLRAFSNSCANLMKDAALGMQSILMSDDAAKIINSHIRNNAVWNVMREGDDDDLLLVRWLEEVLYRTEVHQQWLVDCQIKLDETGLQAMVSFVDADLVEREVEIKAVTTHELHITQVQENEEIYSQWESVPSFVGPGYYCDIVFDI